MVKSTLLSLALAFALVAVARSIHFEDNDLASDESLWSLYQKWRSHHTVSLNTDEKHKRFKFFKENVKFIHEFNKKKDASYKLSLNKFGDMTNEEFLSTYAGSKTHHHMRKRGHSKGTGSFMYENVLSIPASIDWRDEGVVTAVKDQGLCGSCWAFSAVSAVEAIHKIKTNQLVKLSEQELVDCDTGKNQGCNGGLMEFAFEYIKKNGGIALEDAYPYDAREGTCVSKETSPAVTIDGYENVPVNNETALMNAVANQVVSVAIEASGLEFQFYSEGVFTGPCGTKLDHGVAVVGYGTSLDGSDYWIVRNSWGSEWGEGGYIRLQRGISSGHGLCGIAMDASYPIKTSPNQKKGFLPLSKAKIISAVIGLITLLIFTKIYKYVLLPVKGVIAFVKVYKVLKYLHNLYKYALSLFKKKE